MKLDQEYIYLNKKQIAHIIYARCEEDLQFMYNFKIIKCFNSIIYKFSIKSGLLYLVQDSAKVDIDRSIIYEEELIPISDYYDKFTVIGDLLALINYIEG